MDTSIRAGIFGFVLVIIVDLFLPVPSDLSFLPPFLIAMLVIYTFRLRTLKDGLIASFMTYIISEGIVDTIALATYYLTNQIQQSFTIDIGTILSPILWAGTAVLAGYLGIRLSKTRQPLPRQESEPTIPRELQSV
jgi:membrane-associated HD superfamily phosphohydrolase